MKFRSLMRVTRFAVLGMGIFLISPVHAQDAGNVRVARLSLAEGPVLVSHARSDIWEDASVNLPLQEGDTLATQNGRAEIEFDNGATAFLAENSVLQFTRLSSSGAARATELTLAQGAGTFNAGVTGQDSFRIKALTFDVAIPNQAEFRIDGFQDGAAVQVLSGDVSVSTTKGSTKLDQGQSVAVHQKDFQNLSIIDLQSPEDAFNQWVTEQGEMIRAGNKNTLSYINSPSIYGLSDLSRYGTWVNVAGFGYSWRPFSVGFTWTPYLNGRWILNPLLGWTWVSGESWGWTPYHFGSWLLSPNLGWIWVPGGSASLEQWQPARVNWLRAGDHVGWVAMSPNDREGAPANAAKGVIVPLGRTPGTGDDPNLIVSGKNLQNVAPLKQPPAEFASRLTPGASHPGVQSTTRVSVGSTNDNSAITPDRGTRTFTQVFDGIKAPVALAPTMPEFNPHAQVPRVTPPLTIPADTGIRRIVIPPYRTTPALRGNAPMNGAVPARPPMSAPVYAPPRVVAPPPIMPRPAAPPPAQPVTSSLPTARPSVPQAVPSRPPAAAHTEPGRPGSTPRPATQEPKSPAAPGSGDRH